MSSKNKLFLFFFFVLAAVGAVVSLLTIQEHLLLYSGATVGVDITSGFCSVSEEVNCGRVLGSRWSSILGLPLGVYGFLFFFLVGVIALLASDERLLPTVSAGKLFAALSFFGLMGSLGLFLISKFGIGALCPLCLTIYGISIVLFLVALFFVGLRDFFSAIIGGVETSFSLPKTLLGLGQYRGSLITSAARLGTCCFILGVFFVIAAQDYIENRIVRPKLISALELKKESGGKIESISSVLDGSAQGDYFKGPANAPITIVEFSDFECSACQMMHESLKPLLAKYEGKILFIMRNFPLDNACNPFITKAFHQEACHAAELARCAGEQGKFWEFADFLFESGVFKEPEVKAALAQSIERMGLDSEGINECMSSDRQMARIRADIEEGIRLNLGGTPTFFVNGRRLENFSLESLEKLLDALVLGQGHTYSHGL